MKRFVIIVDMQQDFVAADGALPIAGAEELVAPMQSWLATLRPDEIAGVLFTQDTHLAAVYAQSEEAEQFPPHCVRGTPGWELVIDPAVLDPAIPCYGLAKGVFDMWAEPDVRVHQFDSPDGGDRDALFAQLQAIGVEEVVVVGVAADYCVRWAVEGLIKRGFRVTVPADLTRGIVRQIESVAAGEWARSQVAVG